ncbi:MAG: hypothetical protein Q7R53_01100 [bacterium]|nr:hypothetical protein [bacterium]
MDKTDKKKKRPSPALLIISFVILVAFAFSGASYLYKSSGKYLPKQMAVTPTPQKSIGTIPRPNISSGTANPKTPANTNNYWVAGTMTKETIKKDMQALGGLTAKDSSSVFFMESYPLQFKIESPNEKTCEEIRKILSKLKSVESFGECQKISK